MGALSSSLPPDPDKWLLLVSPGPATASDAPPFLVDPSRSGEIMSVDDSRKRYPQVLGAQPFPRKTVEFTDFAS
jgi:hypothetical protein